MIKLFMVILVLLSCGQSDDTKRHPSPLVEVENGIVEEVEEVEEKKVEHIVEVLEDDDEEPEVTEEVKEIEEAPVIVEEIVIEEEVITEEITENETEEEKTKEISEEEVQDVEEESEPVIEEGENDDYVIISSSFAGIACGVDVILYNNSYYSIDQRIKRITGKWNKLDAGCWVKKKKGVVLVRVKENGIVSINPL